MTSSSETITKKRMIAPSTEKLPSKAKSEHLVLSHQFITHQPGHGLNPLVDAAAYLFSIIGKLKQIKSYRHLSKLQKELIQEINHFQEAVKNQGYSSEYILVSRYALCATLDDVISNTLWGGQGQWDIYNMLTIFNQETLNHERFFIILERIIKDPAQYIDVMEFMYLCLSLGFKGSYRSEFGTHQLEQITHSLYKRIRQFRGDHSKVLSPFPIKAFSKIKASSHFFSPYLIIVSTFISIFVIFLCLGYMLDSLSKEAHQEIMHIRSSLSYDIHHA